MHFSDQRKKQWLVDGTDEGRVVELTFIAYQMVNLLQQSQY